MQPGWPRLEQVGQDLRHAVRALARTPGFTAVVVLSLALGIGANAAIFSVVHAVLLKPLPYYQPDRLYSVEVVIPERREQIPSLPVTIQTFLAWRQAETPFASIAAVRPWECNLTGDGEPERLGGARVSANFFATLGVPVARGRDFSGDEEQLGNERVVVISDALWRRRYGADAGVIGKHVAVNGETHRIVGIAPPSLLVPTGTLLHATLPFAARIDIWKPIAPTVRELDNESWDHGVLVRLPPGGNLDFGRRRLETILNEMIHAKLPGARVELLVRLVPMRDVYAKNVRIRLLLLLAASALVLLAACANIANLFLARMANRTGEFAVRMALGAGRARIVSHAVTETVLLAIVGGALGAAVARYGAGLLASYGPGEMRLLADSRPDLPLLLFALATSVATGLACGIVPAWQVCGDRAGAGLRDWSRATLGSRSASSARQMLVGVEMAVGTALLASAGLLLHSFVNVVNAERGYQVERVLAVDLSLFGQRYSAGDARVAFYRELAEQVRGLPGVLAAGAITDLPAVSAWSGTSQTIFLTTDTDFQSVVLARPVAMIRSVTPGYFAASGTSLRAGRLFDNQEPRLVAVISESLARRLWPRDSPAAVLGRTVRQGDVARPPTEIVGVAEDTRGAALDRESPPVIYRPHQQWSSGPMTLVVRTAQEPSAIAPAVRAAIRKMDSALPISAIRTMREIVSSSVAERRFQMMLTSLFAIVGLLLCVVGLYGVVSYSVASRTRDIGLRIALGAMQSDVMRLVFATGMRPVFIGLAVGLGAAVGTARILRSLLFEITPGDPLSVGAVVVVLLVSSGLACYLPARRAAALDPMTALRHE